MEEIIIIKLSSYTKMSFLFLQHYRPSLKGQIQRSYLQDGQRKSRSQRRVARPEETRYYSLNKLMFCLFHHQLFFYCIQPYPALLQITPICWNCLFCCLVEVCIFLSFLLCFLPLKILRFCLWLLQYYIDPVNGLHFRSIQEVNRYLEMKDSGEAESKEVDTNHPTEELKDHSESVSWPCFTSSFWSSFISL